MTLMFCVLMPLSRSAWVLKKNFSLAMWLHIGVGVGYFFDNWRRRTHPHVWILNTPVFLWYIADKVWCCTRGGVNHRAETTRTVIDENYMLLLWQEEQHPKRICDMFWLKHSDRDGKGTRRTREMAHPFTTCSSHNMSVKETTPGDEAASVSGRPAIEIPLDTSIHWKGHRFSLTSGIVKQSNALESTSREARALYGGGSLAVSMKDGEVLVKRSGEDGGIAKGPTMKWPISHLEAAFGGTRQMSTAVDDNSDKIENCANSQKVENDSMIYDGEEDATEATMIGVDASPDGDELAVVVGELRVRGDRFGACFVVLFEDRLENSYSFLPDCSTSTHQKRGRTDGGDKREEGYGGAQGRRGVGSKMFVKRLGTAYFQEFRKMGTDQGRGEMAAAGTWSKMAIVRVHRKGTEKPRSCSCMGLTYVLGIFRGPETSIIADLEAANSPETVPLRAYGPYRSEYGRLGEFPDLPPLLIVATGAGAALDLDFIGFVRANKITPAQPVSVCYSSASLALLQFVTNTLLAERIPGIRVQTALTRHEDLEA
ncbi:unnamed protein product, partial [Pylaiella littoralis]